MDGVRTLSKYLSGTGPWSRGFATAGYQISSIFTSTTILPLPRTDYQSGLVQTNITLPYNVTLTQQLCLFTGCNFFVSGVSRRVQECPWVTYARVGGRHATNGRGRCRRLPNTKFEVFEGISGQTPVAKVMVFVVILCYKYVFDADYCCDIRSSRRACRLFYDYGLGPPLIPLLFRVENVFFVSTE